MARVDVLIEDLEVDPFLLQGLCDLAQMQGRAR
jgi:hypothetical protein